MADAEGPLRLVPASIVAPPEYRHGFADLAAARMRELRAATTQLETHGGALAAAGADPFEKHSALVFRDAAQAADELPPTLDPLISIVSGNVDQLDHDLAGLTGDVAGELNAGVPPMPTFPPMPNYKIDDGSDIGGTRAVVIARYKGKLDEWFMSHVGRHATNEEKSLVTELYDVDNTITDAIFNAWVDDVFGHLVGQVPEPPAPLPPRPSNAPKLAIPNRDGSGGSGDGIINTYRGYLRDDWIPTHFHRPAHDSELNLVTLFHAAMGYVDNAGYNWLVSTYLASQL